MILSMWAAVLLGQELTFGKFHSREEFSKAIAKIRSDEMTKPQVREILGQPDDIWISTDSKKYINLSDGEVWCYGTDGHHTFPTLGSVTFRGNKVLFANFSSDPPSPKVISESELRSAMRKIHHFKDRYQFDDGDYGSGDPLRRVRTVNALIPLGTEKAIAVLTEYSRVVPIWSEDSDGLFWIVRSAFRGKKAGYEFPVPMIGQLSPKRPRDMSIWPTYPVVNVSGFPFLICFGAVLGGFPEPFDWYVKDHKSEWEILDNKLILPNDPFPLYYEVLKQKGLETEEAGRIKNAIANNILRAVRNVANLKIKSYEPTPEEFEKLHQQFLSYKPHWDNLLGLYVRGDGTYDKDPNLEYQQTTFKFPAMKNLKVEVTVGRTSESAVDIDLSVDESGSGPIRPAVIEVFNVDSGKSVLTLAVNDDSSSNATKESMLKRAPHTPIVGGMGRSTGFSLVTGHKLKLILTYEGKSYESNTWVP